MIIIITNIDFKDSPRPPRLFNRLELLSRPCRVTLRLSNTSAPLTFCEPEADKVALGWRVNGTLVFWGNVLGGREFGREL